MFYLLSCVVFPVDCIWGIWSSCSVECGNGTRTRQISQAPTKNGQKCTGPSTEICIVTSCMITVVVEVNPLCEMFM